MKDKKFEIYIVNEYTLDGLYIKGLYLVKYLMTSIV